MPRKVYTIPGYNRQPAHRAGVSGGLHLPQRNVPIRPGRPLAPDESRQPAAIPNSASRVRVRSRSAQTGRTSRESEGRIRRTHRSQARMTACPRLDSLSQATNRSTNSSSRSESSGETLRPTLAAISSMNGRCHQRVVDTGSPIRIFRFPKHGHGDQSGEGYAQCQVT